jgi:hypothetical protein
VVELGNISERAVVDDDGRVVGWIAEHHISTAVLRPRWVHQATG